MGAVLTSELIDELQKSLLENGDIPVLAVYKSGLLICDATIEQKLVKPECPGSHIIDHASPISLLGMGDVVSCAVINFEVLL